MRGVRLKILVLSMVVASFGCLLLFRPSITSAAINPQINFQGKLTNPDGTNVTDGNYSIVFSIYSVSSGGSAIWTETQSSVTVSSGIFQVSLGSVTPLPGSVDFNTSALYLGVKVGADPEMTPRIQFTAAPYAFNASKLNGIDSSGFAQLSPSLQQSGNININGSVTAGSTLQFSAATTASIQSAAGQTLQLDSGTSGSVGVGTTNATSVTVGKSTSTVNIPGILNVNSGTTVPTVDQVSIDNTSSGGVTTAGVNGLNVHYKGGAAAIEAAGMRIDYTPGTTSGGTWSGMRIVENTAAGSGVNSYGLKLEGGGTGAGNSYGIEVATGWDIGIDVQSGGLQLAAQSDPATPTAGNLRIYAQDIAGRIMPKWVGPAGVDTPFQASLGFNRVVFADPGGANNCTTGATGFGFTLTASGTCTASQPTSTNLFTSTRSLTYATSTTAGNVAYQRQAVRQVWRGNQPGFGGFFYTIRFGMNTMVTGNRAFIGMCDSVSNPTNVDPTTSNVGGKIGLAINTNTGNWNLINNISGTAPTVLNLGSSFPVNTTDLYELVLFSAHNGSTIGYRITDISTQAVTSGSLSSNIPSNTTFMSPYFWVTNNTTAAAAKIDWNGWYIESDN